MVKQYNYLPLIIIISAVVPALVAALYFISIPAINPGFDIRIFPKINAVLNSCATLFLLAGFYFIKRKKINAHRFSMVGAIILSAIFLLSYVTYHSMAESTAFGGEGAVRYIYYFILITHIILAALILPLILITFARALMGDFMKHRKIARWTLPLWLYVTVTGVIVYFMISPYY